MAKDREVIAFDTPGNGMSDWPPEPPDMAGYAVAFADGLDNMNLGNVSPVDVFGYHTGTYLAAELAIARPQKVGRLILSGIPFRTPEERQERLAAIDDHVELTEDGAEIIQHLQNLWTFYVCSRDPRTPLDRAANVFMERAKPLDRYWWPYTGVWTYPVPERFPLITQPTLILQPHEALLESTRRAAPFIPDVQFVELPSLDKYIFDLGTEVLAEHTRRFLD